MASPLLLLLLLVVVLVLVAPRRGDGDPGTARLLGAASADAGAASTSNAMGQQGRGLQVSMTERLGAKGDVWQDWPILVVLGLGILAIIFVSCAYHGIDDRALKPLAFLEQRRDFSDFRTSRAERLHATLAFVSSADEDSDVPRSRAICHQQPSWLPSLVSAAFHAAVLAGWKFVLVVAFLSLFVSWWIRATVELKTESEEPFFEDRATRANLGLCQKLLETLLLLTTFLLGLSVMRRLKWARDLVETSDSCRRRLCEIALIAGGTLFDGTEEVANARWMLYRYLNTFHVFTFAGASESVRVNVERALDRGRFERQSQLLTSEEAEMLRTERAEPLEVLAIWISLVVLEIARVRETETEASSCLPPLVKAVAALRTTSVALSRQVRLQWPISYMLWLSLLVDATTILSPVAIIGNFHPEHDAVSIFLWPCLGALLTACVFHAALGVVWAAQDPFDPSIGWYAPDGILAETDRQLFELLAATGAPALPAIPDAAALLASAEVFERESTGGDPHAGLVWTSFRVEDLVGEWLSPTDRIWLVNEDGTMLFEGKHLASGIYDLSEEAMPEGRTGIRRGDGWAIDGYTSTFDILIWTKPGEANVVWRRRPVGDAWLTLTSLAGDWQAQDREGIITLLSNGTVYFDGRAANHATEERLPGGEVVLKWAGGWRVDPERSTPDRLVWARFGEPDMVWNRCEDQESMTGSVLSSFANESEYAREGAEMEERSERGGRRPSRASYRRPAGWEIGPEMPSRFPMAPRAMTDPFLEHPDIDNGIEVSVADAEELLLLLNEWLIPRRPVRLSDQALARVADMSRRHATRIKKMLVNIAKATDHKSKGTTAGWGDHQQLVGDILQRLNEESKVTGDLRVQLNQAISQQTLAAAVAGVAASGTPPSSGRQEQASPTSSPRRSTSFRGGSNDAIVVRRASSRGGSNDAIGVRRASSGLRLASPRGGSTVEHRSSSASRSEGGGSGSRTPTSEGASTTVGAAGAALATGNVRRRAGVTKDGVVK